MNNTNLKELILEISINSDKEAFSKIFDYFAPRIIGYLAGSGTKLEIAEELTQEVLTTVWEKSCQFDPNKANVSTWIFTIARNKKIDRIRKDQNPLYNPVDLIDALYNNKINENKEVEEKIEQIQSILTQNEKNLIKMNFFEGKTHKKISEELEIPIGTVKSRIRNILLKMQKN